MLVKKRNERQKEKLEAKIFIARMGILIYHVVTDMQWASFFSIQSQGMCVYGTL